MFQIGTEGGFLPTPVVLNNPPRPIGYLTNVPQSPIFGNANRYTLSSGFGPNTRTLLEIRVAASGPADPVPTETWLSQIKTALASRSAELLAPPLRGAFRRSITLNEDFDEWGRLIQMIGTNVAAHGNFFGRFLEEAVTEVVNAGCHRGVGTLQPDRGHPPDSLPPGERPDHQPAGVRPVTVP